MAFVKVFLLLFATCLVKFIEAGYCFQGWSYFKETDKCYSVQIGTIKSDQDGHKLCASVGGTLASVHSEAHNSFLYGIGNVATNPPGKLYPPNDNSNMVTVVIGNRAAKAGAWVNTDNSTLDYTYWYNINERNNYPLCGFMQLFFVQSGAIHAEGAGLWRTVPCSPVDWSTAIGAVCQKETGAP